MRDYPFAPFFFALLTDDIFVTMDDYERIGRVLSAGGQWDRERLRMALTSLLAYNPEQAAIIKRRFDSFFVAGLKEETLYNPEEIETALAKLREVNWKTLEPPKPPIDPSGKEKQLSEDKKQEKTLPPPKTFWERFHRNLPTRESLKIVLMNLWELARRKFSIWYVVAGVLAGAIILEPVWKLDLQAFKHQY